MSQKETRVLLLELQRLLVFDVLKFRKKVNLQIEFLIYLSLLTFQTTGFFLS